MNGPSRPRHGDDCALRSWCPRIPVAIPAASMPREWLCDRKIPVAGPEDSASDTASKTLEGPVAPELLLLGAALLPTAGCSARSLRTSALMSTGLYQRVRTSWHIRLYAGPPLCPHDILGAGHPWTSSTAPEGPVLVPSSHEGADPKVSRETLLSGWPRWSCPAWCSCRSLSVQHSAHPPPRRDLPLATRRQQLSAWPWHPGLWSPVFHVKRPSADEAHREDWTGLATTQSDRGTER